MPKASADILDGMTSTQTRPMTIDEFLARPEQDEPALEYLRGEVTEKPMASEIHGQIVIKLGFRLKAYVRETKEARVVTEVRHASRAQDWVFLPDLNVRLRHPGDGGPQHRNVVERAPEMAVEVLSPDDRVGRWLERLHLYMAAGTQLLWVIDPEDQTIHVYRPGEPARVVRAGETLDALPVLRSFTLDVADFFAAVREEA